MLYHVSHAVDGIDVAKCGEASRGALPDDCIAALQGAEDVREDGEDLLKKMGM